MSIIYEAALALTNVEAGALDLKSKLCDGSMLKGHTAKKLADVNLQEVRTAFVCLELSMAILKRKLDNFPKEKTNANHQNAG